MRIDYTLVSASLASRIVRAEILGSGYERDGFLGSDHCPVLLELGGEEEGAGGSGGKKREAGEVGAGGGGGGGGGGDKKRAKVVARHQLAI